MIGKNHFLRTVRGGKNSFSFAFAGKNRKIFLEGRGDRPHCPPLNPPLQLLLCFFPKRKRRTENVLSRKHPRAYRETLFLLKIQMSSTYG
jgi:hypothetical protein